MAEEGEANSANGGSTVSASVAFPPLGSDVKEAYALAAENKMILTDAMLQGKGWTNQRIARVLNALKSKRMCEYEKNRNNQLQAIVRDAKTAMVLLQVTNDDYEVYKCIEKASNSGVWVKDIRRLTKLKEHSVQKAVKTLCDMKKLIKQVPCAGGGAKKVYMLVHLELSKEMSGGSFYSDGEFDEALVERIRSQVCHILRSGQQCTLSDLNNYVRSAGFGRVLGDEDIKTVLESLQLDQLLSTSTNAATGERVYMWCKWAVGNIEELSEQAPCLSCPLFAQCVPDKTAKICPQNCEYFNTFLGFCIDTKVAQPTTPTDP